MDVHVPRKQLAESLGHVERIIPNKSSNPSLSLLRINLFDRGMTFSGSNMDIDIETNVSADVKGIEAQQISEFALPAQVFSQIVKSLPGELVELTFDNMELGISSGSYATKLQLVDPSNVIIPKFSVSNQGSLEAKDLKKILDHVRYAAAVAEYQAIFRGVKLELSDKRTRAVATDGFRLAYYNLELASGLDGDLVIPARSVDEVIKLLTDGEVYLSLESGQLSLVSGDFKTNVKLMEGDFPDYERVIPKDFSISISINAEEFAEAVSRVAVMADKTANNRVDLFIKDGTLQITAEGSYGRSQEALEVSQEGDDPEIALAYNAKYLVDALSSISGDLQIRFSGQTSPSVLLSAQDPNYLAMVVPLRTS